MRASVRTIQRLTAEHHGLTRAQLLGPRKHQSVVKARHLAMWLARNLTGASYPELAKAFERDHATVIYGCRRVESRMEDESLRRSAEAIARGVADVPSLRAPVCLQGYLRSSSEDSTNA